MIGIVAMGHCADQSTEVKQQLLTDINAIVKSVLMIH